MRFHSDVQIHSKYSRATSKNAVLEQLALWARKKGITVVGTGDFTHPLWLADIKDKLVPAEPGLFRLKPEIEREIDAISPEACAHEPVRFMLEVEISTIYKKWDKVRKIHHLIFVPDILAADKLVASLSKIGNLASDGRPILGLDSRNLLEITLQTGPHSYLIPAHIWTPWFAALGSKSGFDSIDDCYGDLAEHVFAAETGLSSDPPMNWRIASLDRFRLVSNSDAHSPPKIGREATTYETELSYFSILDALKTGEGFVGTVEFFPEEGKYHMDGHRKCEIRFTPEQTKACGGICPVCGQNLTVGVSHRIDSLADRSLEEAKKHPPPKAAQVLSLVPLPEILAEIKAVGINSKKVALCYENLLNKIGSELFILEKAPLEEIKKADSSLLAEAISRLRQGKVIREAGYDGEYGIIRMFKPEELNLHDSLPFDLSLQANPNQKSKQKILSEQAGRLNEVEKLETLGESGIRTQKDSIGKNIDKNYIDEISLSTESAKCSKYSILSSLDSMQREAASICRGPLLIIAGPGSGKTHTLTHRIAHLIADHGALPEQCLTVTFTHRAADSMRERLAALLPKKYTQIPIYTFHSLGLLMLKEHPEAAGLKPGFGVIEECQCIKFLMERLGISWHKSKKLQRAIAKIKSTAVEPSAEIMDAMCHYNEYLKEYNAVDFNDLILHAVRMLKENFEIRRDYQQRYRWISIDEYQDLDPQQYQLVRLLAPAEANLCAIGDPNQAIYGFRGADVSCFHRFQQDYKGAKVIKLTKNYRSNSTIIAASGQVAKISASGHKISGNNIEHIVLHAAPTERAEAEFVVHQIEQLLGGHSFFSIDSGRTDHGKEMNIAFSDIAVLYRIDKQSEALSKAFARSGMPFRKHSHGLLMDQPKAREIVQRLREDVQDMQHVALEEYLRKAAGSIDAEDDLLEAKIALEQLIALGRACDGDYKNFVEALPLATEMDTWDPCADSISLLTLHAAKGLEFSAVFIVGLEDGIMPLYWTGNKDIEGVIEEERRLFYVGMTRAKSKLFLSRAVKRAWNRHSSLPASPFLKDIEDHLVKHSSMQSKGVPSKQIELF